MKSSCIISYFKNLYIFFIFLSLNIFFFSTIKCQAKAFDIDNVNISRPFEIDFNKNEVIDEGFKEAFFRLVKLILNSSDQKKINTIKLNEIKGMIESFSIKEEKFINEVYFVNLGVTFNRKKIFNYLQSINVFPSIPSEKKILFIPVIIDEDIKELLLFSNNKIFEEWNKENKKFHLIKYILPTEDLEDLNLIKDKYELIEEYDFKEIINKYNLSDSIIALIFKEKNQTRVLSKMNIQKKIIIKNQSFADLDIDDELQTKEMIEKLKIIYEDYWKKINKINTSIKLPLHIKISNKNNEILSNFEKNLNGLDFVNYFYITKLDKNFTYYQIIFNGTPSLFLKIMEENNFSFNTQNKIWSIR